MENLYYSQYKHAMQPRARMVPVVGTVTRRSKKELVLSYCRAKELTP